METFQVCVIKVMALGRQGGVRMERLVGSEGTVVRLAVG